MREQNLKIAVTGASGYLGSRLCAYFQERGCEVFQLTGNPRSANASLPSIEFSLSKGVRKGFFAENNINALIHAAYDFRARSRDEIWNANVKGSIALFEQARAEGIERIMFISTMSAYEGCRSLYGKAKLEIEKALREFDLGFSVRPGLIYSTPLEKSGGMVGSLLARVQRGGILPLIGNGEQELYLTHEKDLAQFIESLLHQSFDEIGPDIKDKGYVIAANRKPYTFRKIIKLLSEATGKRKVTFLPVPWRGVWLGLKVIETLGIKLGFRSDSVLSLAYQNKHPDFSTCPPDFVFRDFAETVQNSKPARNA